MMRDTAVEAAPDTLFHVRRARKRADRPCLRVVPAQQQRMILSNRNIYAAGGEAVSVLGEVKVNFLDGAPLAGDV